MAIPIKSPAEVQRLDAAASSLWSILADLRRIVKPGMTTRDIDTEARRRIAGAGAEPLFDEMRNVPEGTPGSQRFGGVCCVSVEDEALHGKPGGRILREGDLLTVDLGLRLEGWCADGALCWRIGNPAAAPSVDRLRTATRAILESARDKLRPGVRWKALAEELLGIASRAGLSMVPGFSGHGIGRELHELPVVRFPTGVEDRIGPAEDFICRPGMVFTIEPTVVHAGTHVRVLADGWTVATADGSPSCHEEWTFAITRAGVKVLGGAPGPPGP